MYNTPASKIVQTLDTFERRAHRLHLEFGLMQHRIRRMAREIDRSVRAIGEHASR